MQIEHRWGHHTRFQLRPCSATVHEIRICQNKTCKSQGSNAILKYVEDLHLPEIEATGCGCLGRCGNGPNLVVYPEKILISHVGTVAQMTEVLASECGVIIHPDLVICTQLRLAGNAAARSEDFEFAEEQYTAALEMKIESSYHLLFANRSGVRLRIGDRRGALADAVQSIEHSPNGYTTGYMRLIDVHYLQSDFRGAAEVLQELVDRNPEFQKTSEYAVGHTFYVNRIQVFSVDDSHTVGG